MLFSIVIPVYNVEEYLDECLKSILNQTEQDFEVILVNDGSTDKSADICDFYAKKFPDKIFVYHQENTGPLLTRRSGIAKSKGDFLFFVDSDDYVDLNLLEIIRETIQKFNCDMVMFNYSRVYEDGREVQNEFPFSDEEVFESDGKKKLYKLLVGDATLNNLSMKAIKRSTIDIDRDYREFACVQKAVDLLQLLPIITNAKKIVYIDKTLYCYRQNTTGITMKFRGHEHRSTLAVHEELHKYLAYWGLGKDGEACLYAKELRIIAVLIKRIALSSQNFDNNQIMDYLYEIANSKIFVDAHAYASYGSSEFVDRIIVWLLYKRHIKTTLFVIRLIAGIRGNPLCAVKRQH